jgi:hypothetical protein
VRGQAGEFDDFAREAMKDITGATTRQSEPVDVAAKATLERPLPTSHNAPPEIASARKADIGSQSPSSQADDTNELAELVSEYIDDEEAEWRSFYRWFWERGKLRDVS